MPKKKKSTAAAPAIVKVDPAQQRRYEELIGEIREASEDEQAGWDRKFEAVGEVFDASLYLLTPHGTLDAWAKAILGMTGRNASRNARVAKHFSADQEIRYTLARLDAYLAYVESKTAGRIKGTLKIDIERDRVPIKRGGRIVRMKVIDCTPKELFGAARREVGEDVDARARRSPVEQAFAGAIHAEADLSDVVVRVQDNQLTIGRVPLTKLDQVLRILKGVDWQAALPGHPPPKKSPPKRPTK